MDQLNYNPFLKDHDFITAIKSGGYAGEQAVMHLYSRYHHSVKSALSDLIKLFPGSKTQSDDIVHDAFILMLHKIQFKSLNVSSLEAFWIGIARYLMHNQVKKNGKITLVEEPEERYGFFEISPEEYFLIAERNQLIDDYLSRFGDRCKQILLLWMSNYTMDEIAEQLHLSGAPMARKIKHSCFKKLKNLIIRSNEIQPEDITS
jgi:RNA polymerase sigma factor (sigma-70 family)